MGSLLFFAVSDQRIVHSMRLAFAHFLTKAASSLYRFRLPAPAACINVPLRTS